MEEGPGLDAVAGKRRDNFGGRRRRGGVRILKCEIRMARPRLVCVRMEGDHIRATLFLPAPNVLHLPRHSLIYQTSFFLK